MGAAHVYDGFYFPLASCLWHHYFLLNCEGMDGFTYHQVNLTIIAAVTAHQW